MEKIYLNSEEYEAAIDAYKSKYRYDDMSDEEKELFDERLDRVVVKKEDRGEFSGDAETTDADKFRDGMKKKYGYDDMSDEQKERFDEALDEIIGDVSEGDENPDEPEKVLRRF